MTRRMQRAQRDFLRWLAGQGSNRQVSQLAGVTDEAVRRWRRREGFPEAAVLFELRARCGLDLNALADGEGNV